MNNQTLVNRIPFEDIESAKRWDLPCLGEGTKVIPSVRRKPESERGEDSQASSMEDLPDHQVQPLTAEKLREITEQAELEARQQGYQEGLQQGFSEGEQKGLKQGEEKAYAEHKEQLVANTERFAQLADALMDPVAMQDGALENVVLDMAVHFAKHLLNKELIQDPSNLFRLVERAVASMPVGARNVRVYLHADDVELAHEAFANNGSQWTMHKDAQLTRGGVRVESDQSLVDYSIERRVQEMLEQTIYEGEVELDEMPESPIHEYRARTAAPPDVDAPKASRGEDPAEGYREKDTDAADEHTATDTDNSGGLHPDPNADPRR